LGRTRIFRKTFGELGNQKLETGYRLIAGLVAAANAMSFHLVATPEAMCVSKVRLVAIHGKAPVRLGRNFDVSLNRDGLTHR
jgi:hypothetical protein